MKQNHFFILALFLLILLMAAGCQSETGTSMLIPSPSPTTTPTNTATITQTPTKKPTRTPKPTKTITLTPSSTVDPRDFDASTIKTVTLAQPGQAPPINENIQITPEKLVIYDDRFDDHHIDSLNLDNIVEYLNQGIPLDIIISTIQDNEEYQALLPGYRMEDLTGDGAEEWVIPYQAGVAIIGYPRNKYEVLRRFHGQDTRMGINFFDTIDLNGDGIKEITVEEGGCLMGNCPRFYIYSWNGKEFTSLSDFHCSTTYQFPFTIEFKDTDNNGTIEIVLFHKAIWNYIPDFEVFPDRDETVICMWNGDQFVPSDYKYSDPVYRLQAYEDARGEMNQHNYEKAEELFLRVIHDETLLWYKPGQDQRSLFGWYYELEYSATQEPDVMNDPMYDYEFKRDIYEYPLLASASYYRMMLIYLKQGDIKNAETLLVILKDAYGPGKTGEHITEIAEMVLESYKETGNLEQSCPKAVEYLDENWDIFTGDLTYLRLTDFFWGPQHWCPYLPEGYGEE